MTTPVKLSEATIGEFSKIEWCDHTFNPWIGCQKVSPGCDNCYAETQNAFRKWNGGTWGPHAPRKRTSVANWRKPRQWAKSATGSRPGQEADPRRFDGSGISQRHRRPERTWRMRMSQQLGDRPIEEKHREVMNGLADGIEMLF